MLDDSGEHTKGWGSFPWLRLGTMMMGVVMIAVGPLWASHLHLLEKFAHVNELATNPAARPDAYTATHWREDKAQMREWVIDQLSLRLAELRHDMPPAGWRRRIRALELEIHRCLGPVEFPDSEDDSELME